MTRITAQTRFPIAHFTDHSPLYTYIHHSLNMMPTQIKNLPLHQPRILYINIFPSYNNIVLHPKTKYFTKDLDPETPHHAERHVLVTLLVRTRYLT